MIKYLDTRSFLSEPLPFRDVVLEGIAEGGGLFVPERVPQMGPADIVALVDMPYWRRAATVFERFELGLPADKILDVARSAYGDNFDHQDVAVVRDVGSARFVLELWHGPTLAFKDMALQCMPLFFSEALKNAAAPGSRESDRLILVATSGDTGSAALNGFADRAHVKIAVCYPQGGVSPIQERQMTTQAGSNVTVLAMDGDFDCCQRSVKAVFADQDFSQRLLNDHGIRLSSANSINWGRLLPQIVYYFSAYADLVGRQHCHLGDPIDVCVPSGNFGNLLGAYYAKLMGLPVDRLICASNSNHVLPDFFSTGIYDVSDRQLVKTISPSMDILISSNLERLLFEVTRDGSQVRRWMRELNTSGTFRLDPLTHERVGAEFVADWVDTETCLQAIRRVFDECGYIMDPHTAVAWEVASRCAGDAPMLVVSTAHWSKFPADVLRGLRGLHAGDPVDDDEFALVSSIEAYAGGDQSPSQGPALIQDIAQRTVRFANQVGPGAEPLEMAIQEWLFGDL